MQSTITVNERNAQRYCGHADDKLREASDLIALARCEDAAGSQTLALLQDLIDGIRNPLRRLRGCK